MGWASYMVSAYWYAPPVWARAWGNVKHSVLICVRPFVCCMSICASVRVQCRARCQYSSSFFFSPLYHHDNLLTPAQPHTANISLPSPSYMFIFLTPSPYTLSPSLTLSSISTFYTLCHHLLSLVSPALAFSHLWLSPVPVMCTCYYTWKTSFFLTVIFAESLTFICAALSLSLLFFIFCSLLIASNSLYQDETSLFSPWPLLP